MPPVQARQPMTPAMMVKISKCNKPAMTKIKEHRNAKALKNPRSGLITVSVKAFLHKILQVLYNYLLLLCHSILIYYQDHYIHMYSCIA